MWRNRNQRVSTMPSMYTFENRPRAWGLCLALLLTLMGLQGCTYVELDLTGHRSPVCLNDPVPLKVLEIKHFQRELTAHYTFFSIAPLVTPDIDQVLEELLEEYGGNSIINLKVTENIGFLQGLFDFILFPVWTTRSYRIEGDIVRIVAPASEIPGSLP